MLQRIIQNFAFVRKIAKTAGFRFLKNLLSEFQRFSSEQDRRANLVADLDVSSHAFVNLLR